MMQEKESKISSWYKSIAFYTLLTIMVIILLMPREMTDGISSGLNLCAVSIIPSLFPMMILTDLLISTNIPCSFYNNPISVIFGKIFHVSPTGIIAFVIGAIGGFPIGAKIISELYNNGDINYINARRLLRFCNNTGPAFVLAGIGIRIFNDLTIGYILYVSQLISAIIVGIIFSNSKYSINENNTPVTTRSSKKFSLISSATRSCESVIKVCGFVIFFSFVCKCLFSVITDPVIRAILSSLMEIGNAALYSKDIFIFEPTTAILLSSFSISFSGISVIMQSLSLLTDLHVSFFEIAVPKFVQGVISMGITYIFLLLIF